VTQPREVLRPLTALRFPAALLVFTWHCVPTRRVSATFSFGYIGVAFFFLLSGFILTYTYRDAFRERFDLNAVRAFYAARIARVYPLHIVTMVPMIACLAYLGPNPLWSGVDVSTRLHAVAAQAVLVQSWSADRAIHFGANGPAWSIAVEAFFYALFPLLAYALLRAFRAATPRTVVLSAAAVWFVQTLLLWPQQAAVDDWRWYVFPPARLADFVCGMLLAIAFLRRRDASEISVRDAFARPLRGSAQPLRGSARPLRGRVRLRLGASSVEVLALAAVACAVVASPFVPLSMRFSAWVMPAWGFLILVFADGRGAISRALAHRALVRLGEVSFAFYLCHLAVIVAVGRIIAPERPLFAFVALTVTLLVSFALYHGVEQPLRARVRSLLTRGGTTRSTAVPASPPRSVPAAVRPARVSGTLLSASADA
jgi:peptidoglycan/LPS O-acetylase OafA/YrhL